MELPARRFGEVLAEGINLLKKVWRTLIPPSFGAFMALGATTVIVFRLTGANEMLDLIFNDPNAIEGLPSEELAALSIRFLSAVFWSLAFQVVASIFVSLAAHSAVGAHLAGGSITGAAAARLAAQRMARGLLAVMVVLIAVFAGLLMLVIPGIWLVFSLSMVLPVVALENAAPSQALRRSFQLVKGRWWPTTGFLLLVGLLGSVAGQIVQLVVVPFLTLGNISIGLGLALAVAVVIQGFIIAAIAVMATAWYVDLRAREEEPLTTANLG